jgi:hypothetical protein
MCLVRHGSVSSSRRSAAAGQGLVMPVGADNAVMAADLMFFCWPGRSKFGVWLR